MKHTTHLRLRARMKKKGYTIKSLSLAVGLTPSGLGKKLNKEYPFKWQEVVDISRVLGLNNPYNWFEYEGERHEARKE